MSGDAVTDQPRTITLSLPPDAAGPRSYEIVVGTGVIAQLGKRARGLVEGRTAFLIADDKLPDSLIAAASQSLTDAGFRVFSQTITARETEKTLATASALLHEADSASIERTDAVVALGGGITGDVAGFVAATYRRGIPVIQCPTTLLAMVDASVGGKTGVNLEITAPSTTGPTLRKNMIGAFWQPHLVLADIASLRSLPDRELRAGLAECLKHGLISGDIDPDLFLWTTGSINALLARDPTLIAELISRNIRVKAHFVQSDERETAPSSEGGRALLNLGHTFAHAIEPIATLSPDGNAANTPLLHGEAVAIGLVAAAATSVALGTLTNEDADCIRSAVEVLGIRSRVGGLPSDDDLLEAMGHDKKVAGGKLRLVTPVSLSRSLIVTDPPHQAVLAGLTAIRE